MATSVIPPPPPPPPPQKKIQKKKIDLCIDYVLCTGEANIFV